MSENCLVWEEILSIWWPEVYGIVEEESRVWERGGFLSDNVTFSRDADLDRECPVFLGGGQGGKEGKGVGGLGGEGRERTGSRDTRIFRVEAPGWALAHSIDSFCTSLFPFTNE